LSIRDITERKKADEITKENEERFRALVEHNEGIITVLDKDFKVILEVHHLLVSQVIQMMNLRR
jgi:PAS domain-containing protein